MSAARPTAPQRASEPEDLPKYVHRVTYPTGKSSLQGDLRAFRDVGGRRIILYEPGTRIPVTSVERAAVLCSEMAQRFQEAQVRIGYHGLAPDPHIGPAARAHLLAKAKAGNHATSTLDAEAPALMAFTKHFNNAHLSEITGDRLESWMEERRKQPGSRAGTRVSRQTIRNELMALSALYERAIKWRLVTHNPVRDVTTAPKAARAGEKATWLTAEEAGRLLDAAARVDAETRQAIATVAAYREDRTYGRATCAPSNDILAAARRYPHCEAVLATLLYTGGRRAEVLGLAVEDLDFDARRVHFQANRFRTLKRAHHVRKVEFWRPLVDTLREHMARTGRTTGLLFPSANGRRMKDFAKPFARCLVAAGLMTPDRVITRHTMRHTFATMLLCTLVRTERGRYAERSAYSVMKRLGHRTTYLIETVYGHEIDGRPRSKRLSYERHRALPARRLRDAALTEAVRQDVAPEVAEPQSGAQRETQRRVPYLRIVA